MEEWTDSAFISSFEAVQEVAVRGESAHVNRIGSGTAR